MKTSNRLLMFVPILVLIASTLACGVFSPSHPVEEQSVQSASANETPSGAPSDIGTDSNAVIPCSQLIPPDEIQLLLNNIVPANLSENVHPGGSICSWQYTPNGGNELRLFYLEVSFGPDAGAAWEIKRNYELTQEPADIVVNSISNLSDENYVWASQATSLYTVFAHKGDKTLIMRYVPLDVLYMANESGIIDMVDRFFNRF